MNADHLRHAVLAAPGEQLAASYARRSNPNEEAVGNQHAMNAQRAAADGWHIPDRPGFRFGDDAVSGEKTVRAGLDALKALIQSGEAPFKRLYVRERGRLARALDPRFIYWFEYESKQHGIEVCYSVDQEHVDYTEATDNSKVVARFVTSAVENVNTHNELRAIRARTRYGTRTHVTKAFYVGAKAPFGTERWLVHKATGAFLERVPDTGTIRRAGCGYRLRRCDAEVPTVKRIFDDLEAGVSLRAVAERLTEAGMPSPGAGGWSVQAVWTIARNPLYKGDYAFGRTKHTVPPVAADDANLMGTGPIYVSGFLADPPVSPAQWDVVQRILDGHHEAAQKRRASRPEYLLTGLLRCAGCGGRLHGHTNSHRGGVRMYRHDPPRGRSATECQHANRYLRAQPLEDAALAVTERCLGDEVLTRLAQEEIARKAGELESTFRADQIATERKNIARLERAAAAGSRRELEAETDEERKIYAETVREVSAELKAARARLAALESAEATLAAAADRLPKLTERVVELREVLAGNTEKERKRVVAAMLDSVVVDFASGRVEVRVRTVE